MAAYLLDELRAAPELSQTVEELSELSRRRADLLSGRNRREVCVVRVEPFQG